MDYLDLKRVRTKWRKLVAESNRVVKKTIVSYFDALFPMVFDAKGNMIYA